MGKRVTGRREAVRIDGRELGAFVPHPLPPSGPALAIGPRLRDRLGQADRALDRLDLAGSLAADSTWLVDALARREAVASARLAGIDAKVGDLLAFEADEFAIPSSEVSDARHVLDALTHARARLADPGGPPLSHRVLCEVHRVLMRGSDESGKTRITQVWIGSKRPEGAAYLPPPPESIDGLLAALEKYVGEADSLPPLVRVGLVHVQLASIHPFVDGNGRMARLVVPVLCERWGLVKAHVVDWSVFLVEHRQEYFRRVEAVRSGGDWEGWTEFFLDAVSSVAEGAVALVRDLLAVVAADRARVLRDDALSAAAVRLFELLPGRPLVTVAAAMKLLDASKPTAGRAVEALVAAGVLVETTGRKRDRWFSYRRLLDRVEG